VSTWICFQISWSLSCSAGSIWTIEGKEFLLKLDPSALPGDLHNGFVNAFSELVLRELRKLGLDGFDVSHPIISLAFELQNDILDPGAQAVQLSGLFVIWIARHSVDPALARILGTTLHSEK
jgi:hypothetical protein